MTLQTKQILPQGMLAKTEAAVFELYKNQQDGRLLYHTYEWANRLVELVQEIGEKTSLPASTLEMLGIAAWFFPTGFLTNYEQATESAIRNLTDFLVTKGYPKAKTEKIKDFLRLIEAKKVPISEEQEVFHDAYYALRNGEGYGTKNSLLQLEQELHRKTILPKEQWTQLQLQQLLATRFYTPHGKLTFESYLAENILSTKAQLQKIKKKRNIYVEETPPAAFQHLEDKVPNRAIQTFFRTNYRNHINLSAIADNKANIMISVNAILLSVMISLLSYRNMAETKPMILMAVIVFFITGLTSLIFAVLSARPKVTALNQKIQDKVATQKNIIFFGNFVHLSLEQYEEAMDNVFRDGELMYGNMVRDLYHLGKVLDKKYRYLTTSYNIFMVGFVATSVTLLIALLIN
ncbi:MAG: Pycsar system effector family protein [Bacteroidota bacterium]